MLKKSTRTDSAEVKKPESEEEKPNFLGVLKKSGVSTRETIQKNAEPEPEWRAVKLRASKATSDKEPQTQNESTETNSSALPFTANLRKTENKALNDDEKEAKARESEMRALERRQARQQKEKEEQEAKAARDRDLAATKKTLEQEVQELQAQKEQLEKDLKSLKSQIKKQQKKLNAKKA